MVQKTNYRVSAHFLEEDLKTKRASEGDRPYLAFLQLGAAGLDYRFFYESIRELNPSCGGAYVSVAPNGAPGQGNTLHEVSAVTAIFGNFSPRLIYDISQHQLLAPMLLWP